MEKNVPPEMILNYENPLDDNDSSDPVVDFMELIQERSFIGDVPVVSIFEGISEQFEDYINLEDKNNYVDIFYTQLMFSYDRANNDDSEEHLNEIRTALDLLHQKFIDLMQSLFQTRLTITISDLEAGVINHEDLEFIIRRLYEFFILGARHNFKTVINKDIGSQITDIEPGDSGYFQRIQELMEGYNPLILTITPMQFLQYREEEELCELYENGRIAGNFLRKYSPKFYQNDDFVVEVVNHITGTHQFQTNTIGDDTPQDDKNLGDPPEIDNFLDSIYGANDNEIDLNGIDISEDIAAAYDNGEDNNE